MYELQYIHARPNEPLSGRHIQLESLADVLRTINALIQESNEFVKDISTQKYIDETEFGQTPEASTRYYGDVDKPVASIQRMEHAIQTTGEYKYCIGTTDPALYVAIGVIEFRVVKMDSHN
jgi:hypothetical protein